MIRLDPHRRLMKEMMSLALDVKARMSGIEAAMKEKPSLFNRDIVKGMKEFGEEGLRQRGGGVTNATIGNSATQVAEDFETSCTRVDTLCAKLRRGHFSRNPLVIAGLAIREGAEEG